MSFVIEIIVGQLRETIWLFLYLDSPSFTERVPEFVENLGFGCEELSFGHEKFGWFQEKLGKR